MTIKEAIEYWEQFKAETDDLYDTCSDVERDILAKQREVAEFTISALRAQQENPFGGWISVEDMLPSREGLEPDEVEYVLVSEQSFDAITGEKLGSCVSICGFEHDGWSEFDNFGYVRTENITHWMPLPSTEGLK